MISSEYPVVLIDGAPAEAEDLAELALVNYAHFTAMQVRDGRVRGLALHLHRLRVAHMELFDTEVDLETVGSLLKVATSDHGDCYLRVTLFEAQPGRVSVMTAVRAPVSLDGRAQTLLPVNYVRPFAKIKHVGTFAQIRHGLIAEHHGFDDALLVDVDGQITETTIGNIGFLDQQQRLVWPDGSALPGITQQLVDATLAAAGTPTRTARITLGDLTSFTGAVVTNSTGIAPIARIAEHVFPDPIERCAPLRTLYDGLAWDRL